MYLLKDDTPIPLHEIEGVDPDRYLALLGSMASGSSCNQKLHSRGMNLDLEKVMMTKTDPHPAAFATRQRQNGRSLDSHAAQTAKAAYIFYNTEHSVPGQYSHFS